MFSKDNRQTVLIVVVILFVGFFSVAAIFYFLWQVIGPPLGELTNTLQSSLSINRSNYNFSYPGQEQMFASENVDEDKLKAPKPNTYRDNSEGYYRIATFLKDPDYNFAYPGYRRQESSTRVANYYGGVDQLLSSRQVLGLSTINARSNVSISIPKIGLDGDVSYTPTDEGFWLLPNSAEFGEGTVVALCQRRHKLPKDSGSCWYLDEVAAGTEILILRKDAVIMKYTVERVLIVEEGIESIYLLSNNNELKIITSHPLGSNSHRLVVIAKPS